MTQPTHDKVIAWIDDKIEQIENESPALDPVADWRMIEILKASIASLLANRAGLERHEPDESFDEPRIVSPCCKECSQEYENGNYIFHPCPTYTEIYDPIVSVM